MASKLYAVIDTNVIVILRVDVIPLYVDEIIGISVLEISCDNIRIILEKSSKFDAETMEKSCNVIQESQCRI